MTPDLEARYCPACGGGLEHRPVEGRLRPVCPRCGRVVYADPKLVAAAIIPQGERVLMIRRANEPGMGLWGLPGGFVDRGEPVEEAVCREVREETGLEVRVVRLVGLYSQRGHPVVLAAYEARVVGGSLRAGSDALEARFFPLEALPPLAFPRDSQVLADWSRGASP